MRLANLWQRAIPPEPWQEGDNIPWNDPALSARMLDEHLSQAHDAASRRSATIDRQVTWIQRTLLRGSPTCSSSWRAGRWEPPNRPRTPALWTYIEWERLDGA
jgi:hypothetical protein